MRRYIIRMEEGEAFNAASKARKDAEIIAAGLGYEPIVFRGGRTAGGAVSGAIRLALQGMRNWSNLLKKAEPDSLILVQYPFFPVKSAVLFPWVRQLAKQKNLRFVALVHDLDSLRGLHGKAAEYSDRKVLPLFDAVICHNDRMKEYLAGQGMEREKLIPLGIFDYLVKNSPQSQLAEEAVTSEPTEDSCLSNREKTVRTGENTARGNAGSMNGDIGDPHNGVVIAGNLSPEKCGYVLELVRKTEEGTMPLHLYGKGLEGEELPVQVRFHGAYPPDILPEKLEGSFGLVWDGASLYACEGRQGEYLRYNNPHKLSLYMAAGLPVILWRQAALADFVEKSGVGLLTDSLQDLERVIRSVSEDQYDRMRRQAESTGTAVRKGAFLTDAFKQAENKVLGE